MKKRPRPAKPAARIGGGGYQQPVPVSPRKPPPRKPRRAAAGGGGYQQPPPHRKPVRRKLALGEAVACCAAEALAASLRLTGHLVTDADVLALYELTAGGPDEGATILATLEAAQLRGWPGGTRTRKLRSQAISASARLLGHTAPDSATAPGHPFDQGNALILGLDLMEGPHAVCDDGAAWWSWGQPYDPADFADAVIEEAWEITWPR